MKLEEIGFYTLSDHRVKQVSAESPMWRCELIVTDKCNFNCVYCRGLRDDCCGVLSLSKIKNVLDLWAEKELKNVRFSGGEPSTHPDILKIIDYAKSLNVERIAISTNGSADISLYEKMIEKGANDFSISLDGCCALDIDKMAKAKGKSFGNKVINNIKKLSELTYVTVGVVVTNDNYNDLDKIIEFAHDLGVADIRIISAAQENMLLETAQKVSQDILDCHPILKYRINNILKKRNVRGLKEEDCHHCHLMMDDCVIAGNYHFPCVIYMREKGDPIGKVGPNMRQERIDWIKKHDIHKDTICKNNCLDVCIDYNNRFRGIHG